MADPDIVRGFHKLFWDTGFWPEGGVLAGTLGVVKLRILANFPRYPGVL